MNKNQKKLITLIEINLILISIIAFSYSLGESNAEVFYQEKPENIFSKILNELKKPLFPVVSASTFYPSGCCLETKSGAVCQEMNLLDSSQCSSDLIGTSCSQVEQCQVGCCFDSDSGICSLKAPKEQCEVNGGTWKNDASCDIAECQLGCCALGNSVAMTTSRECTILSQNFDLDKNFLNLDSQGSCNAYISLTDEGACLTPTNDFSGENNCIMTSREKCAGTFREGFLCTAEFLNTTCEKTKTTSCFEGKDEIYYLDSCGNKANIFDSSRYDDEEYWEKIVPQSDSCPPGSDPKTCGNCDFSAGGICQAYDSNKDPKPVQGDYVCRDLSCSNGKQHGESWCVSDYNPDIPASAPVGSGNYVAKCIEGEISIETCADFNQEICIENEGSSYVEAKCIANDWRSCLDANDADTYEEVKDNCALLPQCEMFLDISGNEKYKGLPGFKDSGTNEDQGKAGDIGEDLNTVLSHCVPKYTPGLQFWSTPSNLFELRSSSEGSQESAQTFGDYGGSKEETDSICSLGSFTCVSHIETDTSILGGSSSKDKENPECNIDAVNQGNQQVELLMEALNERCRSLGPCGTQFNLQGVVGYGDGFLVDRVKIDKKGNTNNANIEEYLLSQGYISSLPGKQPSKAMGTIKTLNDLTSLQGLGHTIDLLFLSLITGKATRSLDAAEEQAQQQTQGEVIDQEADDQLTTTAITSVGSLSGLGAAAISPTIPTYTFSNFVGESVTVTSLSDIPVEVGTDYVIGETANPNYNANLDSALTNIAIVALAAVAGYAVGKLIAKNNGMTPAETSNFVSAMMAGFAATATVYLAFDSAAGFCATGALCWAGVIIAIVAFVASLFQESTDHEYYIFEFTCESWEAPLQGDCNVCNEDVRPCTEYKCRSIGQNCQYFTDNGEPGFCTSISNIWQAKITPWEEKLSDNLAYKSVGDTGFTIESQNEKEVPAYTPVNFGIETDKQANCRLDFEHDKEFGEMTFTMKRDIDPNTGRVDGLKHSIVLSPHVTYSQYENSLEKGATTVPLEVGENEYYIKCRNFAGQTNEAAFTVKVWLDEGPDLTPAQILRYEPKNNFFVKKDSTNTSLSIYLNEPAECRYSQNYDYNNYEELPNEFLCDTREAAGYYGEWPCSTTLQNLSSTNKIFIKCKDQPGLEETDLIKRVQNSRSFEYNLNVCEQDLTIDIISPNEGKTIEGKDSSSFNLNVATQGCINGGQAVCSYKVNQIGDLFVDFLNTDSTTHTQVFDTLGNGNYDIEIKCIDEAGNEAQEKISFSVFLDNEEPLITRIYQTRDSLVLKTNENSQCIFNYNDEETGCDFDFDSENAQTSYSTTHTLSNPNKGRYYIKCRDDKLNEPVTCSSVIDVL